VRLLAATPNNVHVSSIFVFVSRKADDYLCNSWG
jgi:hypothetical protein